MPKQNLKFLVFEKPTTLNYYLGNLLVSLSQKDRISNIGIEFNDVFLDLFYHLQNLCFRNVLSFANFRFLAVNDVKAKKESLFERFYQQFLKRWDFLPDHVHNLVDNDHGYGVYYSLDFLVLNVVANGDLIYHNNVNPLTLNTYSYQEADNVKIALGIDQILQAKQLFLIAHGQEVAAMVSKLFFSKEYDQSLPICWVKNHPDVVLMCDKPASLGIFKHVDSKILDYQGSLESTSQPPQPQIPQPVDLLADFPDFNKTPKPLTTKEDKATPQQHFDISTTTKIDMEQVEIIHNTEQKPPSFVLFVDDDFGYEDEFQKSLYEYLEEKQKL